MLPPASATAKTGLSVAFGENTKTGMSWARADAREHARGEGRRGHGC